MVYPLAFLPYLVSLCVWLATTLIAFVAVVRRIAPHPLTPWLALAFPGAFQNFFNGQNGFLSTALLGSGLLLLNQSPWVAGFLLGLVSYKPHLFALVPVALLAARRWQALVAALVTALLLALASFLALRPGGLGGLRGKSGPRDDPGRGRACCPPIKSSPSSASSSRRGSDSPTP